MYLGLIEARYDYQLSYLDQWALAWQEASTKFETFNLVKTEDVKRLQKMCRDFDLLVVLHSVSADSNSWLNQLASLSHADRAPIILFVGNEFSSPFLSTDSRLNLITQVSPEIIASQLPLECASWLYEKTRSNVVAAPPGIPNIAFPKLSKTRDIDLGYRGFPYPWYLLDDERNNTVNEVVDLFKMSQKRIDISFFRRFNSIQWFEFLKNSNFTVSTEAGSKFVFRGDDVWRPIQEYFQSHHKFSAIKNDASGMNFFRRLPGPAKRLLKRVTSSIGVNQASLYKPDAEEIQILESLIDFSKHEYRNGKAISSRHLDAIVCGTWQILKPGAYNDILKPNKHFTPWEPSEIPRIQEMIKEDGLLQSKAVAAWEDLSPNHSYRSRVNQLLQNLR